MPKYLKKQERLTLESKKKSNPCCICMTETKKCNRIKKNCTCPTTMHDDTGKKVCDHSFCFKCINKWSKEKNTCPLCRKEFEKLKCNKKIYKVQKKRFDELINLIIQLEENPHLRISFALHYFDNDSFTILVWSHIKILLSRLGQDNETLQNILPNVHNMSMLFDHM